VPALDRAEAKRQLFQSLVGAMRTGRGEPVETAVDLVSIPRRGNEDHEPPTVEHPTCLFQSLVGAMRTVVSGLVPLLNTMFQSLVGAMRTVTRVSRCYPRL